MRSARGGRFGPGASGLWAGPGPPRSRTRTCPAHGRGPACPQRCHAPSPWGSKFRLSYRLANRKQSLFFNMKMSAELGGWSPVCRVASSCTGGGAPGRVLGRALGGVAGARLPAFLLRSSWGELVVNCLLLGDTSIFLSASKGHSVFLL